MLELELKPSGNQMRGICPIHGGSNNREFVVTPAKGLWYCFGGCGGGDLISLYAQMKGLSTKEAAQEIVERTAPQTVPKATGGKRSDRRLQPLAYLETEHAGVEALGVAPETLDHFGAGYAPKGIMRGRLAIPICTMAGELVAYCGRALGDQQPMLTFPNGFNPADVIFNAHRVGEGELLLTRDPLSVLLAHQSGIENVVAFLTETISAQQLEMLAVLMDEKQCESVELF
jgi:hypothetical protein